VLALRTSGLEVGPAAEDGRRGTRGYAEATRRSNVE
jgi:hypothetical protein